MHFSCETQSASDEVVIRWVQSALLQTKKILESQDFLKWMILELKSEKVSDCFVKFNDWLVKNNWFIHLFIRGFLQFNVISV